jgi:hypothetical protein
MRFASVSYKPTVTALESRLQPGSLLVAGAESSLLAGAIAPLDLAGQDQAQVAHPVNQAEIGVLAPTVPGLPVDNTIVSQPQQSPAGTQLVNPLIDADHAAAVLSLEGVTLQRPGPVTLKTNFGELHGPQGGACENPGNVVVNGDFETGVLAPWVTTDPQFTQVVFGGGDLTPGFHLRTGPFPDPATTTQAVTTDVDQVYDVTLSWHNGPPSDPGDNIQVIWNGAVVADITTPAGPAYMRMTIGQVTGTGTDTFGFNAVQVPDYWHIDDVCVTPALK